MTVLITGGSGCGKSTFAEKLTESLSAGSRVYIATMRVADEESARRVARHRAQRAGKGYRTIECPKDLSGTEFAPGASVLLEDLPNLLANEMFGGGDWKRIAPALKELSGKCRHLVIVTNDVFSDGENYDPSTAEYMRCLAQINSEAARMAEVVAEVVYSIPVWLKGDAPCV